MAYNPFTDDIPPLDGNLLESLLHDSAQIAGIDHPIAADYRSITNLDDPAQHLGFLLMFRPYFVVRIVVTEEPTQDEDHDSEGGEMALHFSPIPSLMRTKDCWKIKDNGTSLSTAIGEEDYGSYCLGPLLRTVPIMVAQVARRGAIGVNTFGTPQARRLAWMACKKRNIHVANFEPSAVDQARYAKLSVAPVASTRSR